MPVRRSTLLLGLCLLLPQPSQAAINPASIVDQATHVLHLREHARIVHERTVGEARLRRVTVVAEVLEVRRGPDVARGDVVTLDYTVDLDERDRAARAHAARGPMPGPQFMGEPDAPELDERGRFWAAVTPATGAGSAALRKAGAVPASRHPQGERYRASGAVFVPAAGQYSWTTIHRSP